jgi:hypothetical protein
VYPCFRLLSHNDELLKMSSEISSIWL